MTQIELLQAIQSRPREDTPRLLYADWLMEFLPDDDQAQATAEFIQVSCPMRVGGSKNRMPLLAYRWLKENWKRLIPKTMELHHELPLDCQPEAMGRWIKMRVQLKAKRFAKLEPMIYGCSTGFEFWKGFCIQLSMWSGWGEHRSACARQGTASPRKTWKLLTFWKTSHRSLQFGG